MYREKFHGDVGIDLVGYRRYGHNEGDEPAYTQPQMYAAIAAHPSVRELYQKGLAQAGIVTDDEADASAKAFAKELAARQSAVRRQDAQPLLDRGAEAISAEESPEPATAVKGKVLRAVNAALLETPSGFTINSKLAKQLDRRLAALDDPGPRIEWAQAESLAFGSLLLEGIPIRLTGQDTVRGTFSQRHLAL